MSSRVAVRFVASCLTGLLSVPLTAQQSANVSTVPEPVNQQADIESGRILLAIACGMCHGIDGTGGRGPNLVSGQLRHGSSDQAIFRNIQSGISGTAMGGFRWADAEIWQIVRYIQSRRRGITNVELPGNAGRGSQLFVEHKCATCHWTGSSGGRLGPDLTRSRSSVEHSRDAILKPNVDVDARYEQVLLILNSGRVLQGLRLNENSYNIQVIEPRENLRTVRLGDVEELHRPQISTMPSYRDQLADSEVDDLIKYLFSLRELP